MRWFLIGLACLVGVVLLVALIGLVLPRQHRVTSRLRLPQPPDSVWAVIRDVAQLPSWWPDVTAVERLDGADGKERWRERLSGDMALVLRIEESVPPSRLRSVIEDTGEPFGGEWIYLISPDGAGSRIEVTEDGWVSNPVFRVVSRIMGHHRTMDSYLSALARKLGASAAIEHVN